MKFLKMLLIIPPIAIGAFVFIYMKNQKADPPVVQVAEMVRPVRVIEVHKISFAPRIRGFGAVTPGREWVATAQVSGEIISRNPKLKRGGVMRAGEVLFEISPVDYELAIAQAKANIRATQARIKELDVNRTNTQAVLDIEKQSLAIREGELARQQSLVNKGTVSRTSFDRERRDTFQQRKKVLDLSNALKVMPTQLIVQKEQVAVYMAQLESAKLNLKRTKIALPFDARISSVSGQVAQFAQPGLTLAKADGIETAEVEAQVPVDQLLALMNAAAGDGQMASVDAQSMEKLIQKLNLKAVVHLKTGNQTVNWEARFERISDTIDPKTRTVGIIVVIDGAYKNTIAGKRPPLTKGLFVEVILSARALGKHIVVPRLALEANRILVSGKDNRLEIRKVETGLVQGDLVVIKSGLEEGDKVVVSDVSPAIAGMLLKPVLDEELTGQIMLEAAGKGISK